MSRVRILIVQVYLDVFQCVVHEREIELLDVLEVHGLGHVVVGVHPQVLAGDEEGVGDHVLPGAQTGHVRVAGAGAHITALWELQE